MTMIMIICAPRAKPENGGMVAEIIQRWARQAIEQLLSQPTVDGDEQAIAHLAGQIHSRLARWGVWPSVCRKLARAIIRKQISAQWLDGAIDQIESRLAKGERIGKPGALLVSFAKNEFAKQGVSWNPPRGHHEERRRTG